MNIQMTYKPMSLMIIIETDHNDPNKGVSPIVDIQHDSFVVPSELKDSVKRALTEEVSESFGFYGHTMNLGSTTNLDLAHAVRSLPSFTVISVDPQINPKPLPLGVQS